MARATPIASRAGQYVEQRTGYKAFVPAPLPPKPPVVLNAELHRLLSDADRALGRLDGSIQTLPNPDLFVFMYVRKEAVLSSQIEGTQSSLVNLLEAEAQVFAPDTPKDVDEVLNYVKAMNYGLERLQELPLCVRLIREIHERLLTGVRGEHFQRASYRRRRTSYRTHCRIGSASLPKTTNCRCSSKSAWRTRSSKQFIRSWTAMAAWAVC
jgi:Fic family protein